MKKSHVDLPRATEDVYHKRRFAKIAERVKNQSDKFASAAREAQCDEDEAAFEKRLEHIASAPPPKEKPKKKKTPAK